MSKNTTENSPSLSYGNAYLVQSETPNYIIGRILTIVEVLGLKETQENSLKSLIRNEVWNEFDCSGFRTLFLPANLNDEIRKMYKVFEEAQKKEKNTGLPQVSVFPENCNFSLCVE